MKSIAVAAAASIAALLPCAAARNLSLADFGIKPGSATVLTAEIQRAIDSCGEGGVVVIGPGDYITGSLTLPSGCTLRLEEGARLLGSTDPFDYPAYHPGAPAGEPFALICAKDVENIRLTGRGTIDGRGLELALAIDSLHHTGARPDPAYSKRRMRPSLRPKLIEMSGVERLTIDSLQLRSSAAWGLSLDKCSDVQIRAINFENRAYWNNDGIDIADCHRVMVSDCDINSADDGIVLKSFDPADGNSDIAISDCRIRSSASAVKFGTESFGGFRNVTIRNISVADTYRSAIALETVDGAVIENVLVDGVNATNTGNAIFLRLGHRRGERPGAMRDVTIRNVSCTVPFLRADAAYDLRGPAINAIHNPIPASATGLPDARLENVVLENIDISYPGRGTKGMGYIGDYRLGAVPECRDAYPEYTMFGELPAWGFYFRHIDGLTLRNVTLRRREPDYRRAWVADDVCGLRDEGIAEVQ